MIPAYENLTITRGRDFLKEFTFKERDGTLIPIDTWAFDAKIRVEDNCTSDLIATFSVSSDTATSTVSISLTDTQTSQITQESGYWDLKVTIADFSETYIYGNTSFNTSIS